MKKVCCMIALAAISFGTVFAHGITPAKAGVMQTDTTKKKKKDGKMKKKGKRDTTKKDTMSKM
ncbi:MULTISPECIES: hypothetical protein [unclassified Mucilaginibacter]|uniref:hypothetical protein n=1 Tax=unclassified Mucilaginibacter TaxID=2617802 RepID=UPI0031F5FF8C